MDEGILWYSVCLCKCGQQTRTEKTWARANPVVLCVCAGVVNRPCGTGRKRREDEGIKSYCVWT